MRRHAVVLLLSAVLAALVGAQGPSPAPPAAVQARQLARNRQLLRAAVENSLDLGAKGDYLERAATCNRLVKIWAGEVDRAAHDHDFARAAEFGGHLNRVVEHGIAGNLRGARKRIAAGSPQERELIRRRDEAVAVLRPLESNLDAPSRGHRELSAVVAALTQVRRDVEAAVETTAK